MTALTAELVSTTVDMVKMSESHVKLYGKEV